MPICVTLLVEKMQKRDFFQKQLLTGYSYDLHCRFIGNYMGFSKNPLTKP